MKAVLFAILAAVCALILGHAAFRQNYVHLAGRIYPRDASVLVLPRGLPEPEALAQFSNLKWLDLRGQG